MGKVSSHRDLSRALRKALGGITQAELAAKLLVSRNYISQIEAELKTPSPRLVAQMQAMLTGSATHGDRVSRVGEPEPGHGFHPSGPAAELRAELRRQFESLIDHAGDDIGRLGWIREQMHQHLAEPSHWGMKERILQEMLEEQRKRDEAEAQESKSGHGHRTAS